MNTRYSSPPGDGTRPPAPPRSFLWLAIVAILATDLVAIRLIMTRAEPRWVAVLILIAGVVGVAVLLQMLIRPKSP